MKKMPGIPEAATNPEKAREFLEATRWPNGPVCPHCKGDGYALKPKATSKRPCHSKAYPIRLKSSPSRASPKAVAAS